MTSKMPQISAQHVMEMQIETWSLEKNSSLHRLTALLSSLQTSKVSSSSIQLSLKVQQEACQHLAHLIKWLEKCKTTRKLNMSRCMRLLLGGSSLATWWMPIWFRFAVKSRSALVVTTLERKMDFGQCFAGCQSWQTESNQLRRSYVSIGLSLAETITRDMTTKTSTAK